MSGCRTLGYESLKKARPYDITVQATPERFQEAAEKVLVDFGYYIREEKSVYLLAVSDKKDAHIYIEWFPVKKGRVRASIWRIKFEMHPLSLDAELGHEYEKYPPDSEIRQMAKKIKDLLL